MLGLPACADRGVEHLGARVRRRFPIRARLDAELRVVEVKRLRPGRLLLPRRAIRHVLEGSTELDVRVGDLLRPVQAGQPPSPAAPVTTHDPA
jgi:hypothetical protein